ncbi:MAG: hypothetical protein M0R68_15970, partial [Bacteroidetes bacterium]|nr:hypothetical protein [Bacteroidota bacterium]
LIVFDPLADDAGKIKLILKDFILGYDENNQPSEFTTLNFFFDRTAFEIGTVNGKDSVMRQTVSALPADAIPTGDAAIAVRTVSVTPLEQLMGPLQKYFSENTNFKTTLVKSDLSASSLKKSKILLLLNGDDQFTFLPEHEAVVAEFIKSGGFIVADVFATNESNRNWSYVNNFFGNIVDAMGGKLSISRVPSDHILYSVWKKFEVLPPVDIDLFNMQQKGDVDSKERMFEFMMGLYYENKLIGILSNRGYSISWGEFFAPEFRQGKNYSRQRELLSNIIYYATQIHKNEK